MCTDCISEYNLVTTNRGNFVVLTEEVDEVRVPGLIPGIEYLTTITPIGMMICKDIYDVLMLFKRYGSDWVSAYVDLSHNRDMALIAHEKAVMLASTHDFEWMDDERQREILYGFTSEEQEAMGTGL